MFSFKKTYIQKGPGVPVGKVLDCNIVKSELKLQSRYWTNNSYSPQVKYYLYSPCGKMDLALNIPQRLICHLLKKPKPSYSPVGKVCRIRRLHLGRGERHLETSILNMTKNKKKTYQDEDKMSAINKN